jgi:hypothetical protein
MITAEKKSRKPFRYRFTDLPSFHRGVALTATIVEIEQNRTE